MNNIGRFEPGAHHRALALQGPESLAVVDVELPELPADHLRLAVVAGAICGSDLHSYHGQNGPRARGVVMGHEIVGRVARVSAEARNSFDEGDRIIVNPIASCGACRSCRDGRENICENRRVYGGSLAMPGGFADVMDVATSNVLPFPGSCPDEWGALVEPFAVAMHAAGLIAEASPRRVLVLGGGIVGIALGLVLRDVHDYEVVISEPRTDRRDIGATLGLTMVTPDKVDAQIGGFDVAVDCVGAQAVLDSAFVAVRNGGTVIGIGIGNERMLIPRDLIVIGERRYVGSSAYSKSELARTAQWLGSDRAPDLSVLIGRVVTLEGLVSAFQDEGTTKGIVTLFVAASDADTSGAGREEVERRLHLATS